MAVAVQTSDLHIVAGDGESILSLAPLQGLWTEEQYLRLTDSTNRRIEFTNGRMEVLPVPSIEHEGIVRFLFLALYGLMQPMGGTVFFAGVRLQIRPEKYRYPDILLLLDANDPRRKGRRYWQWADLVMEVISPDDPERDTKTKRADYAEAGVPEYWIVNPEDETITVLRLAGAGYVEHGVFQRGDTATSALLPGFAVAVNDVLDAH